MKINIEYNNKELIDLIYRDIQEKVGELDIKKEDIMIVVKSQQNYKAEWEPAMFKAEVNNRIKT